MKQSQHINNIEIQKQSRGEVNARLQRANRLLQLYKQHSEETGLSPRQLASYREEINKIRKKIQSLIEQKQNQEQEDQRLVKISNLQQGDRSLINKAANGKSIDAGVCEKNGKFDMKLFFADSGDDEKNHEQNDEQNGEGYEQEEQLSQIITSSEAGEEKNNLSILFQYQLRGGILVTQIQLRTMSVPETCDFLQMPKQPQQRMYDSFYNENYSFTYPTRFQYSTLSPKLLLKQMRLRIHSYG